MNIYTCRQWMDDLDAIIETLPELHDLTGQRVLVTGATGLVCSALADIFIRFNEINSRPIEIYAAGRSTRRIHARFREFAGKSYFHCVEYDATNPSFEFPIDMDYIIHGASVSSPDHLLLEPVETMLSNIGGIHALLDFSIKHGHPRLLFISSSEVYGKREKDEPYKESQYGYVDLLNVRNAYATGKRAAEAMCISYAEEYGADVVIARPGHVFGPTAKPDDMHVSSSWMRAAVKKEPIILKSAGNQLRSYCYCLDVSAAIIKVLLRGENRHAYNISSADSVISLRKMAEIIAEIAGVQLISSSATAKEKDQFNPMNHSELDGSALQAIGWKASFPIKIGIERTFKMIREMMEGKVCLP